MAAILSKLLAFTLDPALHWLVLAVIGLLLAYMRASGVKRTFSLMLFYMSLVLLTPVSYWLVRNLEANYPPLVRRDPLPAVVILTGGTVEFNNYIDQYQWYEESDRLLVPAHIWKNSQSLFILTGRSRVSERLPYMVGEAESMAKYLKELGVSPERIIIENRARTTRENAENVQKILQARKISDFYLVTSAFHMWRSVKSFEKLGLEPKPFPVGFSSESPQQESIPTPGYSNIRRFRLAIHEHIGVLYYKVLDWLGA